MEKNYFMAQTSIKEITQSILESVMNHELAIQHFACNRLPDKESIYKIISDLFIILFPGYFGHSDMSSESIELRTGYAIARAYEFLQIQVTRELMHHCKNPSHNCGNCEAVAKNIVMDFLKEIPNLRIKLEKDVKAAFKNDPAAGSYDEIIFSYPGFEAVTIHRIANFFHNRGLRLIARIMSEYAHSKTGVDIHPGATIGDAFFIDHGTGVVVGETTVIGNNVTIYQGVTLGALNFPRDVSGQIIREAKRHPTIGNGVIIYAGATILGGATVIGDRSVIGGNVWLTESVPSDSKVIIADTGLKILHKRHHPEEMQ